MCEYKLEIPLRKHVYHFLNPINVAGALNIGAWLKPTLFEGLNVTATFTEPLPENTAATTAYEVKANNEPTAYEIISQTVPGTFGLTFASNTGTVTVETANVLDYELLRKHVIVVK